MDIHLPFLLDPTHIIVDERRKEHKIHGKFKIDGILKCLDWLYCSNLVSGFSRLVVGTIHLSSCMRKYDKLPPVQLPPVYRPSAKCPCPKVPQISVFTCKARNHQTTSTDHFYRAVLLYACSTMYIAIHCNLQNGCSY